MAIRLSNGAVASPLLLVIHLVGDGVSTEVVVDLVDPPVNLDLKGNPPSSVLNPVDDSGFFAGTVTGTMQGTKLHLILSEPIQAGEIIPIFPLLFFDAAG